MLPSKFCFLSHECGFGCSHMTSGCSPRPLSSDGGLFRKLWRAVLNREPYDEPVRLKQSPRGFRNLFTSTEWK